MLIRFFCKKKVIKKCIDVPNETKLLGLIIDLILILSWIKNLDNVVSKMSSGLEALW